MVNIELDQTREQAIQSAKHLVSCLEDGADEDAHMWLLQLLLVLYRVRGKRLGHLEEAARSMTRGIF